MHDWFVIFGAKVKRDGTPSMALAWRVHAAVAASRQSLSPMFLPTGGRGRWGHVEAEVMRRMLLDAGIPAVQIICEVESPDTLSSVLNCARLLNHRTDVAGVFTCTDGYHQLRCRLLFRLAGISTRGVSIAASTTLNVSWKERVAREIAAVPVDCFLMLVKRLTNTF